MTKILCVYATRQIDSNLFMSSTIFSGLQQCGYDVDMVFMGYQSVCDVFAHRYARYFDNVKYILVRESSLKRICDKTERTKLLYSFYIHFVKDYLIRPYSKKKNKCLVEKPYDVVLSFIPPSVSGYLAMDIKQSDVLKEAKLIQFWTDPLSLGRCNDVTEIPRSRFMHMKIERQLLGFADKAVFCYPLLCKMEQKLHPEYADKMTWSDVGYTEHQYLEETLEHTQGIKLEITQRPESQNVANKIRNNTIARGVRIGLFGSYHSKVRNIFPLLETFGKFPNITFVVRGDSDIKLDPKQYPNLDYIEGRRPVSEIEKLESQCDILLCLGGLSGITHPAGKVFYYANYPKPIVYIGDGAHNDFFKNYLSKFGRYIICDNNPESLETGIKDALMQLDTFKLEIPESLEPRVIARRIIEE